MIKKFIKLVKSRYFIFSLLIIVLFSMLGFRLAYLTVDMGEHYYHIAQERKKIEVTLKGARGNILDRNGIPLAVNRQIYVAQVDRRWLPAKDQEINSILKEAIEIIEQNEDTILDNIPIKKGTKVYEDIIPYSVDGFYYDFGTEQAGVHLRRYNNWRRDTGIREDIPADQMLGLLRERYTIDPAISDELARKIISIRLDLYLNRFRQDEPVKIAEDIDVRTVSHLETYANELAGIQTVVELGRYYPYGTSAQHIIGYVGRFSDNNMEAYEKATGKTAAEAGYNVFSDKYGQDGMEAYAEAWLTGNTLDNHGYLQAEVDASRRVIQVLDQQLPKDGNDVVLSLDIRLQRSTETILEEELQKMRDGVPPYDDDNQAPLANTAATVVLDVNTGEILTMASYANSGTEYNLNDFAQGIGSEKYGSLERDPTKPLFPIAWQGGMEPGSTFKMLVGLAALEEGKVSTRETILDRTKLNMYAPRCWSTRGHGSINLIDALKVSCNYYFTAVGERMDIWELHKWAEAYGLHGHTGLELLQMGGRTDFNYVSSPDVVEANRKRALPSKLKYVMGSEFGIELTDQQIRDLIEIDRQYSKLIDYLRMEELVDEENQDIQKVVGKLYDVFREGIWDQFEYYGTFIGQSATRVSPLAMARYVAALVNGNRVMDTHVLREVRSSEGKVMRETQPKYNQLDVKASHTEAIKEGMRRVVYGVGGPGGSGSGVRVFADMDPDITLGGKTGTAQVIPGRVERNTAWFVSFTPYENPEVAVVVAVPNGKTSGNASPIARRIIEEYFNLKNSEEVKALPDFNQLIP